MVQGGKAKQHFFFRNSQVKTPSAVVIIARSIQIYLGLKMFSRWMYVLSFTGGSNAGGGRINTPPPEAAMPEVEEKTNLLVNRLED